MYLLLPVLSASSAYFSAMFTGSLREAQQNEVTLGKQNELLILINQFNFKISRRRPR